MENQENKQREPNDCDSRSIQYGCIFQATDWINQPQRRQYCRLHSNNADGEGINEIAIAYFYMKDLLQV